MDIIPYGKQDISQADIDAVVSVLHSDFITQGPCTPKFEQTVADYCGALYAVATNSATSALHLACLALGLEKGDWLWTSPITFVASANCGLYCGAKVDFVDIDPITYNLCPYALEKKLELAKKNGRLPKVVVPVHLCGHPCDMKAIHALSQQYGFFIIEDASHAIGGKYKQEPIGNCRYSNITVFSFHPVKIITTGEGGMALSNDKKLAERIKLLRSHGITRDPSLMTHETHGPWYYQQIDVGFNYRMTDLQAALGVSQMSRLDEFVTQRQHLAKIYDEELRDLPLTLPRQQSSAYSSFHLYVVRINLDRVSKGHREIFERLRSQGIRVNLHYIPIPFQPYYREMGFQKGDFPKAEQYYREAITLPLYARLTEVDQDRVIASLREIL